jgi:tetrahydromethanopterin S-methyltransferase subunit G
MAIKIKRCVKKYNRGISKVISPEQTYRKVLKRIKKIEPKIFVSFREIKSRSGIPQYFIRGTDY